MAGSAINLISYFYGDEMVSYFNVNGYDVGFSIKSPISMLIRNDVDIEGVFTTNHLEDSYYDAINAMVVVHFTPHLDQKHSLEMDNDSISGIMAGVQDDVHVNDNHYLFLNED